jgi:integrase
MLNFVAAPEQKLLKPSEVPHFKLPAASEPRDRWLRTAELQKLIDAAAEIRRGDYLSRGEIFLWLALETAARKTAIVELTWDRVDFETKTIDYNVPGRKKTKKRRSTVPISKALLPILVRAFEERNTESDLVLGNKHDPWKSIRLIAKRAKVPGVSQHVLRHTAATHMARRGVPLWQIAGILANTVAMVEKVYAKHAPDGLVDAVNAISSGQLEAAE